MKPRTPAPLALLCALLATPLAGCLGTPTPDERRASEIGTDGDEGPEHNPGQPCVLCHGEFHVAGTVFLNPTDPNTAGLEAATVWITDAQGREFTATTNEGGNFAFTSGGEDEDGIVPLSFVPEFPLRARVTQGDLEQEMVTLIQRERSCNACHAGPGDEDNVARIHLVSPP